MYGHKDKRVNEVRKGGAEVWRRGQQGEIFVGTRSARQSFAETSPSPDQRPRFSCCREGEASISRHKCRVELAFSPKHSKGLYCSNSTPGGILPTARLNGCCFNCCTSFAPVPALKAWACYSSTFLWGPPTHRVLVGTLCEGILRSVLFFNSED